MNASELSRALSAHAEAVCRRYLPNGRKTGRYWICGDVRGRVGRSMHVRLAPPGVPGKWTDEATGEHGDLLDIIATSIGASQLRDAIVEAHRFLALPVRPGVPPPAAAAGSPNRNAESAHRIWKLCRDIAATHADAYLRSRQIAVSAQPSLRFHPTLLHRDGATLRRFPALVAAVLDNDRALRGIHRTWLDPRRPAKAPLAEPRKTLGAIRTHAVRFGTPGPDGVLIAGEGIETVLSVVTALPAVPAVSALSSGNLRVFVPAPGLRRLVIAADNDDDGRDAALRLRRVCRAVGLEAAIVQPRLGDFNDDLREFGPEAVASAFAPHLIGS